MASYHQFGRFSAFWVRWGDDVFFALAAMSQDDKILRRDVVQNEYDSLEMKLHRIAPSPPPPTTDYKGRSLNFLCSSNNSPTPNCFTCIRTDVPPYFCNRMYFYVLFRAFVSRWISSCVKTLGLDAKIGGIKCLGKAAADCSFITNFLANAMFNTACLSVISLIRANSWAFIFTSSIEALEGLDTFPANRDSLL